LNSATVKQIRTTNFMVFFTKAYTLSVSKLLSSLIF
jgi:hypothetical protein